MPTNASRSRGGYVYYPIATVFYPYWKITITADDSTVYTIADFVNFTDSTKNYLTSAQITNQQTTGIASAVLKFANTNGIFTGKFNGGEVVEIYADFTNATTLQFRGKLDNIKLGVTGGDGFYVEADARSYPELTDTGTTGREVATAPDVALCDLLNEYYSSIKLDFWNGTSWVRATYNSTLRSVSWSGATTGLPADKITMSWQNTKGWQVISEICQRVGLECYLYYDTSTPAWVLRIFTTNGIQNNNTSVTYGTNLIGCTDFGYDNSNVYNSVKVFGKQESDNIILMATEEDSASIANLWRKDKNFNETALTSMDEVRTKAEYELNLVNDPILAGRFDCVGLHNINPGEQIMIFIPNMGVSGYYTIDSYTHTIGTNGFLTSINIKSDINKLSKVFKEKVDFESEASPYINLNNMKDSLTIYFDGSSEMTDEVNTEEVDGKLQLMTGYTDGYATSNIFDVDYDVTECELRKYVNYPFEQGDTYEVSNDGGDTWETYDMTSGSTHTFTSVGHEVRLKLTLHRDSSDATSPTYESVCLLVK